MCMLFECTKCGHIYITSLSPFPKISHVWLNTPNEMDTLEIAFITFDAGIITPL